MSKPRVSVVIPTYNRGKLLVQAVSSALAQTFGDLEVIVADDGSDDGSPELVAESEDARVEVLRLDHSGIPAVARNAGLARARGELVAFLDSDDVWFPEKLERQVAIFDTDPSVGLVCSNARVIDENGDELRQLYLRPEQGASGDVLHELLQANFVVNSSAIARRDVIARMGGLREDLRLRGVEDYELWLRVGSHWRIRYLPEALVDYRQHVENMWVEVPLTRYWASVLAAIESLDGFLGEDDQRRRTLLRPRRAALLIVLARAQRSEVGWAAGMRSLRDALRLDAGTVSSHLLVSHIRGAKSAVRGAVRKALALG